MVEFLSVPSQKFKNVKGFLKSVANVLFHATVFLLKKPSAVNDTVNRTITEYSVVV